MEVSLEYLATTGGLATLILVLIGLGVKPTLLAKYGEDWPWSAPIINISALVLGVALGVTVFGFLSGWEASFLFLGGVTGAFSAASAVGIYTMARNAMPSLK